MGDLFRWLLQEPIAWLIVASWLFSSLGGAMQKAARKAQEQQGQRPGAGRSSSSTQARPSAAKRREARSPEDIAREIRRAMGLEEAPVSRPAPAPIERQTPRPVDRGIGGAEAPHRVDYDELAQRRPTSLDERPPRVTVVYDQPTERPRRGLREEMAERDEAARRNLQPVARVGGKRRMRVGRYDLNDPAAAIVAMEILGRPVALREPGAARYGGA
jgi:hypothetical protein